MTGPALLRTIIANPQDDGARLVYADWLQEQGDGERAELIQVQIAWARCENRGLGLDECKPCEARQARERDLLAAHWPRWGADWFSFLPGVNAGWLGSDNPVVLFDAGQVGVGFARGFPVSVTCDAASWLQAGDALSWSPEQTVPCPTCKGSQYVRATPCRTCCPDGESKALVGPSTVPRPMPPTAQPIVEVRLTTRPEMRHHSGDPVPDADDFNILVYLGRRWPAVKVWHLPPEPWVDEHPRDDRGRWTAADEARAVNGDPDAPLPLGVMDVETTDWDSAASLSAAPPDNARRRAGHSRMPEWLSARRGQRPTQRPSRR